MIQHLFTLIWNRRRANFLLITEIFLAFVVLFVVGSVLVNYQQRYRSPLGFAYQNVWRVSLDPGAQPKAGLYATGQQVIRRLRSLPGVQAVTRSQSNTPFLDSHNVGDVYRPGKESAAINSNEYQLDDDGRQVLDLRVEEGRWFDRRDEGSSRPGIIISRDLQQRLFPGESALGKLLHRGDGEKQVIGVMAPYRADGDLAEPKPAVFIRTGLQDTSFQSMSPLLVLVRPGAGAALERQMTTEILAIGKGWNVGIISLPEQRAQQLKRVLTPIVALVLVCVFLVLNVALGLFGVLWQTINQRRGEIGLRRAIGASAGRISGQVVGEILVVTTFGLALGLLVAMQFPLLHVLDVPPGVYARAMLLATGLIYVLTTLCALYPSRLAAGIHPAVALREE